MKKLEKTKNTNIDYSDKKLIMSDVMKRSLIEEFKGLRMMGTGDKYWKLLKKEERHKMQKRYVEVCRLLQSNYTKIK
jgi:hypothetical protein